MGVEYRSGEDTCERRTSEVIQRCSGTHCNVTSVFFSLLDIIEACDQQLLGLLQDPLLYLKPVQTGFPEDSDAALVVSPRFPPACHQALMPTAVKNSASYCHDCMCTEYPLL
jgi:hypothetical protein